MVAAARLKLAAPLIGKGEALPGRNGTAGPRHSGGSPVPLSIAITVRGGFLARAKLSACLNIANPKMSGVLEAAAEWWQGEAELSAGCWLRTSPCHGLGHSDVLV